MKKALIKDTFREIKKTKGRFFSILAIIALGVAFFVGIKASSPVMTKTVDKYLDDNNFMDIMLISNLGIVDEDINELKKLESIENIYPTYSKEVLTSTDNKEYVLKAHAIPKDNKGINKVNIVEGEYPKGKNECLIEYNSSISNNIKIGDSITLYEANKGDIKKELKNEKYKVVGYIKTPYYIAHAKGSSNIGNGSLDSFVMIPEDNFKSDIYTEAYVTLKNSKEFNSYTSKYEDYIKDNVEEIEVIGNIQANKRYDEVIREAKNEINKASEKLKNEESKVNKQLGEAKEELDKSKNQLENSEETLNIEKEKTKELIENSKEEIKQGKDKLNDAKDKLIVIDEKFEEEKININNNININKEELNALKNSSKDLNQEILILESKLENESLSEEEILNINKEILLLNTKLQKINTDIKIKEKEIETKENFLNEAKNYILLANKEINNNLDEIIKQEEKSIEEEENALLSFKLAKEEINEGYEKLNKGYSEYEKNKEKAEEEIKKGKKEIKKAKEELSEIKEGKWYILDRNSNYGFVDFKNSAKSIEAISKIFPVFFFSIAALICLTTMTRMVDEQRTNIGTMKALGYNNLDIMFKYISYALIASLCGSILGGIIGFNVFPLVIYNAYATMSYNIPKVNLIFDVKLMAIATIISILTTTLAVVFSCIKELKEVPSNLMRPKAPQVGKRILMERIPFIWNKLSFIQKVTFRNIFRYKKRFFMTVIGIAGCSALLVTGFGIKDSISSIVDNQYNKIFKYDATLTYDIQVEDVNKDVEDILKNDDRINDFINVKSKSFKIINDDIKKDITIIVPSDSNKINNFINFNNRINNDKYTLNNNEVIITEKISKLLNIQKGDLIKLENEENELFEVKVGEIVENYVNHYMFMDKDLYQNTFKENVAYNQILIKNNDRTNDFEEKLGSDLSNIEDISSVVFNSLSKNSFEDMVKNLDAIVILIIISSGTLAFIVLYNLTNVNISERIREIATIKVLGFYDLEVSSYVFRENIILTTIGTLLGLFLGIFLHQFIMVTAELEFTMFGREIKNMSFIYAGLLTMIFACIVNLAMYHKLKTVEMVESLKSVD